MREMSVEVGSGTRQRLAAGGSVLLTAFAIGTSPMTGLVQGSATTALLLLTLASPLAALATTLVLSPARALIATEGDWPFPFDIGLILLLLTAISWLFWRFRHRREARRFGWSGIFTGMLLFLLATGLSVTNAISVSDFVLEWSKWWIVLFVAFLVVDIAQGQRWRFLLLALGAAGMANALIGIYIFLGGSGADHLAIGGGYYRAFGTFGQPNPFGGFMGLLLPVIAMAFIATARRVRSSRTPAWAEIAAAAFFGVTAVLLATGLIFSWSRGAWLGALSSLLVLVIAYPRRLRDGLFTAAVVTSLATALLVSGLLPASVTNRITSATEEYFNLFDVRGIDIDAENYAVVERLAHWQAAIAMATEQPYIGVGLGNYDVRYAMVRLPNWDAALGHAHNLYLNLLAETGIIGLLAYLLLWGYIVKLSWNARSTLDPLGRAAAVGLLGAWAYLAVHSMLDNLYVNNVIIHIGVMLGILVILHSSSVRQKRLGLL
jgi:putative inorganic carbon (hco3(-)) transporter